MEDNKNIDSQRDDIVACSRCGRSENESAVFPVRFKGSNTWVCARCLPALIHG